MNWTVKMIRVVRALAASAGAVMLTTAMLAAQSKDGFVPATDITKESLPATPLVYGAYGFVWLALVTYVFLLWRRIGKVERELSDVTAKIAGRR